MINYCKYWQRLLNQLNNQKGLNVEISTTLNDKIYDLISKSKFKYRDFFMLSFYFYLQMNPISINKLSCQGPIIEMCVCVHISDQVCVCMSHSQEGGTHMSAGS